MDNTVDVILKLAIGTTAFAFFALWYCINVVCG